MKTLAIVSGILYLLAIIIGALLQILHWPYGVIIQNTGFFILVLIFIPSLIFYIRRLRKQIHKNFR